MAFFALSGITGCITSGETSVIYGEMYNNALIESYYKKDYFNSNKINSNRIVHYGVVCVFGTKSYLFKFLTIGDRNVFYNSLP